jgi:hypothetical protein
LGERNDGNEDSRIGCGDREALCLHLRHWQRLDIKLVDVCGRIRRIPKGATG